ncbi:MAG: hypothetical protein IAE85_09200 [Anaerolinea sp.]|nr:hypothetical protein [Anaerolinea sp.]
MAEFLLVVERLMADGADAAMMVDESTYKGAMFGCAFVEPVHGYVWCDRHGWVRSDEACVCDDCVWEALQAQAEALQKQHAAEFGEDWLDEGDHGEMAYRRINAREKAEFPHGEFDDGAHWREPAQALCPLSPGQWACEPCGDPDDGTDRLTDEEEEDLFFYWLYDESGQYDPVGRCRCGGIVVTQPGTMRVVCVECGADYPESPGWE